RLALLQRATCTPPGPTSTTGPNQAVTAELPPSCRSAASTPPAPTPPAVTASSRTQTSIATNGPPPDSGKSCATCCWPDHQPAATGGVETTHERRRTDAYSLGARQGARGSDG